MLLPTISVNWYVQKLGPCYLICTLKWPCYVIYPNTPSTKSLINNISYILYMKVNLACLLCFYVMEGQFKSFSISVVSNLFITVFTKDWCRFRDLGLPIRVWRSRSVFYQQPIQPIFLHMWMKTGSDRSHEIWMIALDTERGYEARRAAYGRLVSTERPLPLGHLCMFNCVPLVNRASDLCFTSQLERS